MPETMRLNGRENKEDTVKIDPKQEQEEDGHASHCLIFIISDYYERLTAVGTSS